MSTFYAPTSELYHYGRLGMKWGEHVFGDPKQRAIRKTYSIKKLHPLEREKYQETEREKREAGIKKGIFNDRISKGSSLVRYSDKHRESPDRSKYASLTKQDVVNYGFYSTNKQLTSAKDAKGVYSHELKATIDLKVAKGKDVTKYIMKKYGTKELREMQKTYEKAGFRYADQNTFSKVQRDASKRGKDVSWMWDESEKQSQKLRAYYHDVMYHPKANQQILDHYRKRGYDAIADPEDYAAKASEFNYPVILLHPRKSVKTKRVKRIK